MICFFILYLCVIPKYHVILHFVCIVLCHDIYIYIYLFIVCYTRFLLLKYDMEYIDRSCQESLYFKFA